MAIKTPHASLEAQKLDLRLKMIADFEGFPQRYFEDILHLTKVRVRTFWNFFQPGW
jgi:hypothetical protein